MVVIGYVAVLVVLSVGLASCETGGNSSIGGSDINIGFLRREGFMDDFQDREKMIDRMMNEKAKMLAGRLKPIELTSIFGGEADEGSEFNRFGEQDITTMERSAMSTSQMLPHAGCQPYDQVIDVPNPHPNVVMYPACVVVKRCGGCCGHPSLACRAVSKDKQRVMVMRYVYDGSLRPARQVTYEEIEIHQSCTCGCKIEKKDCNDQIHNYDDFNCKCVCKNENLANSCPTNKRWNPDLCACQCIELTNCGAGYMFDLEQCRCVAVNENSGSNNNGQSGSNVGDFNRPTTPASQPDNIATQTVDPCRHLRCPENYITHLRRGRCRCRRRVN